MFVIISKIEQVSHFELIKNIGLKLRFKIKKTIVILNYFKKI